MRCRIDCCGLARPDNRSRDADIPHFFDHSFTYLIVPMITALVYDVAAVAIRMKSKMTARRLMWRTH